eukprot:3704125-Rhodomonas_salina.1
MEIESVLASVVDAADQSQRSEAVLQTPVATIHDFSVGGDVIRQASIPAPESLAQEPETMDEEAGPGTLRKIPHAVEAIHECIMAVSSFLGLGNCVIQHAKDVCSKLHTALAP